MSLTPPVGSGYSYVSGNLFPTKEFTLTTNSPEVHDKQADATSDSEMELNVLAENATGDLSVKPNELYNEKELDPMRRVGPANYNNYLDRVKREQAEVKRANLEGREPDLENPGPEAGSPERRADFIHNPNNQNVSLQMLATKPSGETDVTTTGVEPAKGQHARNEGNVEPGGGVAPGKESSDILSDVLFRDTVQPASQDDEEPEAQGSTVENRKDSPEPKDRP